MKVTEIAIKVDFPIYCENPWDIILTEIKKELPDIVIEKLRFTYFESNYGICDFPAALILSQFMGEHGLLEGFSSHIARCSGEYVLSIIDE